MLLTHNALHRWREAENKFRLYVIVLYSQVRLQFSFLDAVIHLIFNGRFIFIAFLITVVKRAYDFVEGVTSATKLPPRQLQVHRSLITMDEQ